MFSNNRGGSTVAVLLYIMVAILVVYGLFKVAPLYMDYYAMDDEVSHEINMAAINSDEVIINDLYEKAQERDLPITKDDIALTREGGNISIDIAWSKEVDFGYGFKRDFDFEVSTSTKKKEE